MSAQQVTVEDVMSAVRRAATDPAVHAAAAECVRRLEAGERPAPQPRAKRVRAACTEDGVASIERAFEYGADDGGEHGIVHYLAPAMGVLAEAVGAAAAKLGAAERGAASADSAATAAALLRRAAAVLAEADLIRLAVEASLFDEGENGVLVHRAAATPQRRCAALVARIARDVTPEAVAAAVADDDLDAERAGAESDEEEEDPVEESE